MVDDQDISPEEIELAAIIEEPLNDMTLRSTGRIVLADELPNGSGFVKYLHSNIDMFLKKCTNPEKTDKFNYSFINEEYFKRCQTSSYDDLKTYRNLNYHGILDLRLAISFLRILRNPKFLVGIDDKWDNVELTDWRQLSLNLAEEFSSSINDGSVDHIFGIPRIRFTDFNVLVVHPFWNSSNGHIPVDNILTKAILKTGLPEDIYLIDTFNLARRPGWCYQDILNWFSNR